jgi:21S rRNA (GM2251-2'-O)-methyltransferase
VLNPGNLGAIIRSAYFLGIDAMAISMRTCSPITPAALKASAGAAEAIQILAVNATAEFLDGSVKNGWKICAAVTPDVESPCKGNIGKGKPGVTVRLASKRTRLRNESDSWVGNHPLILVVGGEEVGLRENIRKRAHYFVDIRPGIDVSEVGVDSLNVSTAAALVCSHILEMSNKLPYPKRNEGRNIDV